MSIIVCGLAKGKTKAHRCSCCGFEDDDWDRFATSGCWDCSFGGNFDCKNCLKQGVPVDRFSNKSGKLHRMIGYDNKRKKKENRTVLTKCGVEIPYMDAGAGIAVREPCKNCWPEGY